MVAAIVQLCLVSSSGAEQHPLPITTGNMLHQECLDAQRVMRGGQASPAWPIEASMNAASCVSFLSAIYQFSGQLAVQGVIRPVCNWGIRTDQLVDAFINFSNAHPQMRSILASDFVLAAIEESFGCADTDWPKNE
jgi:hypothetical protein